MREPSPAHEPPAGGLTSTLRLRTIVTGLGVFVQGLVRFLYTLLVARSAGAVAVGAVNATISLGILLTLLWPSASGLAVVRFSASEHGAGRHEEAQAATGYLARQSVLASLPLAAAAAVIGVTVLDVPLSLAASGAAFVVAYSGYLAARGVQYAVDRVPRAGAWEVASGGVALVLLLVVLVADASSLLLLPLVVGYGLFAVVLWPRGSWARPRADLRRQMRTFVVLTALTAVASVGFLQLSMVVARIAQPGAEAGYYAVALALATPLSLLAFSLGRALTPAIARALGKGEVRTARWMTDVATRSLVAVVLPVVGFIALASDPIVRLLYGAEFTASADLLPVLVVAVMPTAWAVPAVSRLSSTSNRLAAAVTATSVAGLLVGVVVWPFLSSRFGVTGVAVGYLVGALVIGLGPLGMAWWLDHHPWTGLMVRTTLGVSALVGMLIWQERQTLGGWLDLLLGAAFVAGWLTLSWRDARTVLRYAVLRRPLDPPAAVSRG